MNWYPAVCYRLLFLYFFYLTILNSVYHSILILKYACSAITSTTVIDMKISCEKFSDHVSNIKHSYKTKVRLGKFVVLENFSLLQDFIIYWILLHR